MIAAYERLVAFLAGLDAFDLRVRLDWKVEGELTIRGVTKPVTLDATFGGVTQSPWGPGEVAFFSGRTKIDREAWGMTWNKALETGGVLVSKDIEIEIEAEATYKG